MFFIFFYLDELDSLPACSDFFIFLGGSAEILESFLLSEISRMVGDVIVPCLFVPCSVIDLTSCSSAIQFSPIREAMSYDIVVQIIKDVERPKELERMIYIRNELYCL